MRSRVDRLVATTLVVVGLIALTAGDKLSVQTDSLLRVTSVAALVGLAVAVAPLRWPGQYLLIPMGIWAIVSALPLRPLDERVAAVTRLPLWPDMALVFGALGVGILLGGLLGDAWRARSARASAPQDPRAAS